MAGHTTLGFVNTSATWFLPFFHQIWYSPRSYPSLKAAKSILHLLSFMLPELSTATFRLLLSVTWTSWMAISVTPVWLSSQVRARGSGYQGSGAPVLGQPQLLPPPPQDPPGPALLHRVSWAQFSSGHRQSRLVYLQPFLRPDVHTLLPLRF